ncbi:MAG: helix-turn-helix transcriptional regulator [Oscillospiraceae bacterium]|nr:helix-turn-helix transcriptional regulator [Oscillospiraceae bacterium]
MENYSFGEKLRLMRKRQSLTQSELAEKVGLATSTVGMYEQNRREPGFENLIKFSNVLSANVDYLLGASEDPEKYFSGAELESIVSNFLNRIAKLDVLMVDGVHIFGYQKDEFLNEMRRTAENQINKINSCLSSNQKDC